MAKSWAFDETSQRVCKCKQPERRTVPIGDHARDSCDKCDGWLGKTREAREVYTRWDLLIEMTTPSGKRLFRCRQCQRVSPTPDKVCPAGCKE